MRLDGDDGMFHMKWEDFCAYMGEIGCCAPFMQTGNTQHGFHCANALGTWNAMETAGGPHGLPTFRFNPRYNFVAKDPTVTITLYQLDQRGHAVHVPWIDMALYVLTADAAAGLFDYGHATKQLEHLEPLISLSRRLESKAIKVMADMEYTLVACAHSAGVQGHFCITVASQNGVELRQILEHQPNEAERAAMARNPSRPATCYVCKKGFSYDSGENSLYYDLPEGRVHSSCFANYENM